MDRRQGSPICRRQATGPTAQTGDRRQGPTAQATGDRAVDRRLAQDMSASPASSSSLAGASWAQRGVLGVTGKRLIERVQQTARQQKSGLHRGGPRRSRHRGGPRRSRGCLRRGRCGCLIGGLGQAATLTLSRQATGTRRFAGVPDQEGLASRVNQRFQPGDCVTVLAVAEVANRHSVDRHSVDRRLGTCEVLQKSAAAVAPELVVERDFDAHGWERGRERAGRALSWLARQRAGDRRAHPQCQNTRRGKTATLQNFAVTRNTGTKTPGGEKLPHTQNSQLTVGQTSC